MNTTKSKLNTDPLDKSAINQADELVATDYKAKRISQTDQQALYAEAQEEGWHPLLYLFIVIGFGTGMRAKEILSLRWEYIDFVNSTAHIPKSKTGKRNQRLPESVAEALRYHHLATGGNPSGFVFLQGDKTVAASILIKQFKELCNVVGLSGSHTVYDMRYTVVAQLIEFEAPYDIIGEFVGHSPKLIDLLAQ